MIEKSLWYLSNPTSKLLYFQSKVSVHKTVLHGQHCASPMQYNLQDQRFQKILMSAYRHHLKSFALFMQWKSKFSKCIWKLWIPVTFNGISRDSWQAPASSVSLYAVLAKIALSLSLEQDQGDDLSGAMDLFQLDQLSSLALASSAEWWQRAVKNRQEKVTPANVDLSISTKACKTKAKHLILVIRLFPARLLLLNNPMMYDKITHRQQELPLLCCHHH